MRKVILYTACSVDGKIADKNGGVEWLNEIPNPEKSDYGYADFFDSIDTTIMGNATYQQVLGFGVEFPYKNTENFVLSRDTSLTKDANVQFISENVVDFITEQKSKPGKNIWCIGGAAINGLFLGKNLLDEIQVFIMPVLLGEGIPLASQLSKQCNLELIKTISYESGVLGLSYKVKHN